VVEAVEQRRDLLPILDPFGQVGSRGGRLDGLVAGGQAEALEIADDPPGGHTAGDHAQVGRQARAAGELAEHAGLVAQALEHDLGDGVVAVGRREGGAAAGGRPLGHVRQQRPEPVEELGPGPGCAGHTGLDQPPVIGVGGAVAGGWRALRHGGRCPGGKSHAGRGRAGFLDDTGCPSVRPTPAERLQEMAPFCRFQIR
jgi:hypothetical protein